tara:strand:- start:18051 stop:18614 length:564 start_codon:yes stop_codon:yes gene_type:complete
MNGGYESIATIKSVKLEYEKYCETWGNWKPTWDLFLTVTYNNGQTFNPEFEIYGMLNRNFPVTDSKSWGQGFKVKTLFESALGRKNLLLNDDYSIPDSWLDEVVNKEVLICSYPTTRISDKGKNFWNHYQITAPANAKSGVLKQKVINDVNNGYIKDYFDDKTTKPENEISEPKEKDSSDEEFDFEI